MKIITNVKEDFMNNNNRKPAEGFSPGDFIQEEIKERGWTQEDFAKILGKPLPTVNQIIKGKRAIIPETAKKIAAAFGNSPQFWMNLETSWQLYNSESSEEEQVRKYARLYELLPVREMQRRGWIKATKTSSELEKELNIFFGASNFLDSPEIKQAARMSANHVEARAAFQAWCRRSFLVSQLVQVNKFIKSKIPNLIKKLRLLFSEPEEVRHVPRILAEFGVRLVVVQHLKGTHLDGAAVLYSASKPVISLSMRYGRLDYFWFTLIHELAHIFYEDGTKLDVNIMEKKTDDDEVESRANKFAASTLVPTDQMKSFILRTSPIYSTSKIMNFSRRMGVHPAIVIGQLKKKDEEIVTWDKFSRLHNRINVRDIIKSTAMCDGWGQVAPVSN